MIDDRTFELKVGIWVTVAVIVFFYLVFSIGDFKLSQGGGYRITSEFSFIDGVAKSAPVRYAGVDVGHVENIRIINGEEKTKVEVVAFIDNASTVIEKDAVATINTLGLLGEKYIEIFPGNLRNGVVTDGDPIASKDPTMMRDITETLNELAESATGIFKDIRSGKGTVGKLLTEEKIYNDLEAFVADIKAHPWKLLNKPRGDAS